MLWNSALRIGYKQAWENLLETQDFLGYFFKNRLYSFIFVFKITGFSFMFNQSHVWWNYWCFPRNRYPSSARVWVHANLCYCLFKFWYFYIIFYIFVSPPWWSLSSCVIFLHDCRVIVEKKALSDIVQTKSKFVSLCRGVKVV